jgi:hypothetical protein
MDTFSFNKLIDTAVLFDLYENDYTYIEKIFQTALVNIESDLERVRLSHRFEDGEGLRKAIHKLKPTFGFLGMPFLERECSSFEKKCTIAQSTGELSVELDLLLAQIDEGKRAVEDDYRKLIIFNKT